MKNKHQKLFGDGLEHRKTVLFNGQQILGPALELKDVLLVLAIVTWLEKFGMGKPLSDHYLLIH
jgi:hypothetical protein